jgi:hypothetical protein
MSSIFLATQIPLSWPRQQRQIQVTRGLELSFLMTGWLDLGGLAGTGKSRFESQALAILIIALCG